MQAQMQVVHLIVSNLIQLKTINNYLFGQCVGAISKNLLCVQKDNSGKLIVRDS